MDQDRIVIAGAGSIGCFVGGMLVRGGREVVFLARPRLVDELGRHGLALTDFAGLDARLPPAALRLETDPARAIAGATLILVAVKSGQTDEMAATIAAAAPPAAVVVSLQNGVENPERLRRALPGRRILAGMVPFNVVQLGGGRFHRGTGGDLVVEADPSGVADRLSVPDLPVRAESDMPALLWGKLLINLNNALNALSGIPLRDQLADRRWRALLADQMEEALALLAAAGIRPKAATALPPRLAPFLLRLPTPLFRLIGGRSLKIDPAARSSMWEDLDRRRPTEIGELQGAVLRLAERLGRPGAVAAPVITRVAAAVAAAEAAGTGSPHLSPERLIAP